MSRHTFSHIIYCDTNILSYIAKNKNIWNKLFEFLTENDLTLGIGGPQLSELSDATRLHKTFSEMFVFFPSVLLKPHEIIFDEEVKAHPNKRKSLLSENPLNSFLMVDDGIQKLQNQLFSSNLSEARNDQLHHAAKLLVRHNLLKDNFPKNSTGKYSLEQADEFAEVMVIQWLSKNYRDFLKRFQINISSFHPEIFLSIRLFAHFIFYKFYLGNREPNKIPDFGDLAHIFLLPYCDLAIMERDNCNVLNQIKRNQDTLNSTVIRNIDFFKDWHYQKELKYD